MEKIGSNAYKVVLFDKEIPSLDLASISKALKEKDSHSIMFYDSSSSISEEEKNLFDKIIKKYKILYINFKTNHAKLKKLV